MVKEKEHKDSYILKVGGSSVHLKTGEVWFRCEFCARQGERVFFATLEDLKGHIRAFHGGYPDVRKVTHELQS
jgi:hypothetical protein